METVQPVPFALRYIRQILYKPLAQNTRYGILYMRQFDMTQYIGRFTPQESSTRRNEDTESRREWDEDYQEERR